MNRSVECGDELWGRMTPLPMPLSLPLWELGQLKVTPRQIRSMLGTPHLIETDVRRTAGGNEEAWAYLLPSGQRILIVFEVAYGVARLIADPPEIGPVVSALGIARNDRRLRRYAIPVIRD